MKEFKGKMTLQLEMDFGFDIKPDATQNEIDEAIKFFNSEEFCEAIEEGIIEENPNIYSCKVKIISSEPFCVANKKMKE